MGAPLPTGPREAYVPVAQARLYVREIGHGPPILILHGGPDFDHRYLLPDLDRLAAAFHLIYHDQRGRGRSAAGVRPEDVTLASDVADIDAVRQHCGLRSVALLGHSWGGLLALEYALRHPERVSHLILMNTAPVSQTDFQLFRQERRARAPTAVAQLEALAATAAYQAGDPDTVAAYYRLHFQATLRPPMLLDRVIASLRASFTREGILLARAIEDRLLQDTWLAPGYDLLPSLAGLRVPALVLHGDYDFVPVVCAAHIARALAGSRFIVVPDCGHFAYVECPDAVRQAITAFLPAE
jgi:proline iminopeptidase